MDEVAVWRARLRWRFRGALLWPAFAALTVVDALLLRWLPVAGDGGTALVPALLLAGFANLIAVAVLGRLGARLLRRRRPALPKVVADDTAGAALVCAVTLAFLAAGLLHRADLQEARADQAAQVAAAERWFAHQAPPEYRGAAGAIDSLKLGEDLYRSCAPGKDPDRWLCLFVSTDSRPPGIRLDTSRESNTLLKGPAGLR